MSANVYRIEDLLIGKTYSSKTLTGEIVGAEKHPHAVWYDGAESYLVEVRNPNSIHNTFRSIAVKVGE